MKMRRPWQPHMSNDSLFNPFIPPTDRTMTLDHIEFLNEEEEEEEKEGERNETAEGSAEETGDQEPAS